MSDIVGAGQIAMQGMKMLGEGLGQAKKRKRWNSAAEQIAGGNPEDYGGEAGQVASVAAAKEGEFGIAAQLSRPVDPYDKMFKTLGMAVNEKDPTKRAGLMETYNIMQEQILGFENAKAMARAYSKVGGDGQEMLDSTTRIPVLPWNKVIDVNDPRPKKIDFSYSIQGEEAVIKDEKGKDLYTYDKTAYNEAVNAWEKKNKDRIIPIIKDEFRKGGLDNVPVKFIDDAFKSYETGYLKNPAAEDPQKFIQSKTDQDITILGPARKYWNKFEKDPTYNIDNWVPGISDTTEYKILQEKSESFFKKKDGSSNNTEVKFSPKEVKVMKDALSAYSRAKTKKERDAILNALGNFGITPSKFNTFINK